MFTIKNIYKTARQRIVAREPRPKISKISSFFRVQVYAHYDDANDDSRSDDDDDDTNYNNTEENSDNGNRSFV